jgi:hypothetical protein
MRELPNMAITHKRVYFFGVTVPIPTCSLCDSKQRQNSPKFDAAGMPLKQGFARFEHVTIDAAESGFKVERDISSS